MNWDSKPTHKLTIGFLEWYRDQLKDCPAPIWEIEQYRFPVSKKARIKKKWRKDLRNWRLST